MYRAIVRQYIRSVTERVRVAFLDRQTRCRPSQVDQAHVAQRLAGQLLKFWLVARFGRLADYWLAALVPGHSPAVGMQTRQRGEVPETLIAYQVCERCLIAGSVTEQSAHLSA